MMIQTGQCIRILTSLSCVSYKGDSGNGGRARTPLKSWGGPLPAGSVVRGRPQERRIPRVLTARIIVSLSLNHPSDFRSVRK